MPRQTSNRMTLKEKISGKLSGLKSLLAFDNFVQLVVERVGFPKTKSVIHRIDGMEFLVDYGAGEQNGTRACVGDLSYACFTSQMALKGPIKVLDLGANGGGFPLMLRRLNHTVEKIVAVELNPRTYGRLCFNLHRNFDCEIQPVHAGVTDRSGTISLALGEGSIGDSIFLSEEKAGVTMKAVPLIALKELIESHFGSEEIDICKIDIEGAEFPILESEGGRVLSQARHLIIEIHGHPQFSEAWVHERLSQWGFDLLDVRSSYEPNVFGYRRR